MKIADKSTKAVDLVQAALDQAEKFKDHNVFISMNAEKALERAKEIDEKIARGEEVGKLAGVPYALKDNYSSHDGNTTAAAHILDSYHSPITAEAVRRIEAEGAIMIGRANLDAFAHGGSTENSYFGPTKNAADDTRVAGGSSGGSAVAVALDIVEFALGSDTGGSIRQPASFNGVYGIKPTYGAVSRYGVVAMASSTDTMGCFAKKAEDVDLVMSIMAGKDAKDSTTLDDYWTQNLDEIEPAKKKIGLIRDCFGDGIDPEVAEIVRNYAKKLEAQGYEIEEFDMPILKYGLAIYYVVQPAEVASNLSRYDGIRYALRSKDAKDLDDIYTKSRSEGFMKENKRRIMIGNFVLSSGFYDAYFLKAAKARTLIVNEYAKAFTQCDFILTPVSPNPAFKLGEKVNDPVAMYLEDVMSVSLNLAGVPGLAIPAGETPEGLALGLQLIGPRRSDKSLIEFRKELI